MQWYRKYKNIAIITRKKYNHLVKIWYNMVVKSEIWDCVNNLFPISKKTRIIGTFFRWMGAFF